MSAALAKVRASLISCVLCAALLPPTVHGAEPAIPKIGVLVTPLKNPAYEEGLRAGLRELGYVEGQNIIIEWRRSATADEKLRALASELARSKVDVIVAFNTPTALTAVAATTTPVVFASADPVAVGLAASLARPGGTATGISGVMAELTAKRLELLRSIAPTARRIGCLINSSNPVGVLQFEEAQSAATSLGIQLVKLDARSETELDDAVRAIARNAVDGIVVTADFLFLGNKAKIAGAIRKAKLPAIFPFKEWHSDGVLMSYGPSATEIGRKLAVYVDKILKGAKPAELPIEQVSKYELVIDLRVAREIGLKVPQALLQRADEVIR